MKDFLGIASLVIALVGYIPYLTDILVRKTKPHAFSWLVWSMLAGIAFAVQVTHGAGSGAWLMGFTAIITFIIFGLSIKFGEKNILAVDWLSLLFAALALLIWLFTNQPLFSVILISFIDAIGGFFPTFRKSITNPHQETAVLYFLYGLSLCFSLIALQEFTMINALYPASFVFINWFMGIFLLVRRKKVSSTT